MTAGPVQPGEAAGRTPAPVAPAPVVQPPVVPAPVAQPPVTKQPSDKQPSAKEWKPFTRPVTEGAPRPRRVLYTLLRPAGRALLTAAFAIRAHGRENVPAQGPLLMAGNHASVLDGPLVVIYAPEPPRTLTKKEAFVGPLNWALHAVGMIPVDRSRPDRTGLTAALAELQAGGRVGVFPEGTRGTGELASVHHGLAYLALRAGCPIVPVAVLGSRDVLPKGRKLPRWRTGIDIVYGTPFTVQVSGNPRSRSATAEATEQIRVRLLEHLTESRKRFATHE